jgi:hypothetical protein
MVGFPKIHENHIIKICFLNALGIFKSDPGEFSLEKTKYLAISIPLFLPKKLCSYKNMGCIELLA